ncbi:AfsR/SARP family transcriptional regulator [Streptomyces profundus]|uniref:AfsR/SARP family transcriptional regulator n=1 Tax=Streptomyces profundus TaxID=2867410 RepID=UPI001D15EB7A|nr:NB-ARC domain-containing protein [Streptomyces sp. MA3_2.13]UED87039.1 AfsR/SARP family transcriptional regulator [Streptomyces sp. MA3_2.13]
MDIRLLGVVRVLDDDGAALPITAPLTCATLAALALRPGEPVRTSEVVARLWGPRASAAAASRLRGQVARLRRVLPEGAIRTVPGGYLLDITPEQTDLGRFTRALEQAGTPALAGPEAALAALERVLPLWTGNPLMGLPDCPLRSTERLRLRRLWLAVLERRSELRLAVERPAGGERSPVSCPESRASAVPPDPSEWTAIEELERLEDAEAGPDHDRGWGSGEFAELAELASAPDEPGPAVGLPAGIGTFVARAVESGRLRRWLTDASAAPTVCLIDGSGGVGKSTLAVRVARELVDRFPDGLLYVDLRGADPRNAPLAVGQACQVLLAAMGRPGKEMPQDSEVVGVYQRELAGRRVLLLLDNAMDSAQVAPLLPTEAGAAALVTSRSLLAGAIAGHRLHLEALSTGEATTMVRAIAGAADDRGDADEWAELARLCGRLPLALRIIATRMAARPHWRVADFLERLRDERRRMDELMADDLDLRASLMVSIDQLAAGSPADERLATEIFPALGASVVRSYSPGSVAAMVGSTAREAGAALDRLTDARIADSPRPEVYTLHDLVRSAAGWQAARMPEEWLVARLAALANWYVGSLYRLNQPLALPKNYRVRYREGADRFPAGRLFTSVDEALPWADEMMEDVLALAEQLSAPEFDGGDELGGVPLSDFALQSARALETYFGTRLAWGAQRRLCELTLTIARRRDDRFAEAVALGQLGKMWGQQGEGLRGAELLRWGIKLFRSLGETSEALALTANLVPCLGSIGRLEEAKALAEETLTEILHEGQEAFRIQLTNNLARCHLYLGDHATALGILLDNYASAHVPYERTMAAGVLTEYYLEVAEYEEAERWSDRGMAHAAEQPFDPFVAAQQRTWRAEALRGLGREESAHVEEMQAKAVIEDLNSRENSHLRVRITDRYLTG